MNSLNEKKARTMGAIFGGLIVIASAALTFSFFFENLPALVPQDIFGPVIAGIIAGLLGVLVYEAGALVWLWMYLYGSENNDQRNTAITMSAADILGGAVASFAQIIFAGTGLVTISDEGQFYVGIVALLAVALGIVFNFVAHWHFKQNSEESKTAIREANRRAVIQDEEENQARHLDKLVAQKVAQKLAARAESIAEEKAEKVVRERIRLERKGSTEDGDPLPQSTPALPQVQTVAVAAEAPAEPMQLRESTGKA